MPHIGICIDLLFRSTSSKVKESWARGVEWELTRLRYPAPYRGRWFDPKFKDYTLVVPDMIDGPANPSTRINNGFTDSRDEVSGYTIKQLEDALKGKRTWNEWRDNIKAKYSNSTENNLDKLFRAYE